MKGRLLSELAMEDWDKVHKYITELAAKRISEESKKRGKKNPKRGKKASARQVHVDVEEVALRLSKVDANDGKNLFAFDPKGKQLGLHNSPALIECIEELEDSRNILLEKIVEETANKKRTREKEQELQLFNKRQAKRLNKILDELSRKKTEREEKEIKLEEERIEREKHAQQAKDTLWSRIQLELEQISFLNEKQRTVI